MFRRPRPSGARHPPPLAPTYSAFKPRSEWTKAGASMFLYVNLPGFYRDQIQIKRDETTRMIQIQGQRALSTQTWARFNEFYRVPESCDMSRMQTSFARGLLTIELPIIDTAPKPDKRVLDEGKEAADAGREKSRQKLDEEGSRMSTPGGSLERKKPVKDERPSEARRATAVGPGEKAEEEDERLAEKKEAIGQKANELEGRTSAVDGRLGRKQPVKDEKPVGDTGGEEKEAAALGVGKVQQKEKEEESKLSPADGSLGRKQPVKDEKPVGDVGSEVKIRAGVKPEKAEGADLGKGAEKETRDEIENLKLGPRKKPGVLVKEKDGDREIEPGSEKGQEGEQRRAKVPIDREKKEAIASEDTKERVEKGTVESETSQENVSMVTRDREETDQKEKSSGVDDLGKNLESGDKYFARGRATTAAMDNEELGKYRYLVNVGVAALVIVGLGAYLSVPLLKLFY